jgi:broad specificity phosphatase PhoE
MNIFLVRHGESVQNTNLFDCDFIDKEVPLTIKGINQASRLNVVFRKISKDLNLSKEKTIILSSDYHRAETTKELMNAHPNKIKDVGSDPRIREQSWGLCGSSL